MKKEKIKPKKKFMGEKFGRIKNWIWEAWNELKDLLHKNVEKRTGASKEKHPKIYKIIFVFFIIFILLVLYFSYKNYSNNSQQATLVLLSRDGNECKKIDLIEWETGQGELIINDNLWSIASMSSNGMLRYKESIQLSSEIKITFVPYSEKQINFILLVHDLYEIVIGDGGYQGVTLKASPGNNRQMRTIKNTEGYTRNIFEKGELNSGVDVTVVLNQKISRLEDDSYEINISILYRSGIENEEDKLFATYDFPLPPKFNYEKENMKFSMGLLAANDNTDVSVEVLCFEASQIIATELIQ